MKINIETIVIFTRTPQEFLDNKSIRRTMFLIFLIIDKFFNYNSYQLVTKTDMRMIYFAMLLCPSSSHRPLPIDAVHSWRYCDITPKTFIIDLTILNLNNPGKIEEEKRGRLSYLDQMKLDVVSYQEVKGIHSTVCLLSVLPQSRHGCDWQIT